MSLIKIPIMWSCMSEARAFDSDVIGAAAYQLGKDKGRSLFQLHSFAF